MAVDRGRLYEEFKIQVREFFRFNGYVVLSIAITSAVLTWYFTDIMRWFHPAIPAADSLFIIQKPPFWGIYRLVRKFVIEFLILLIGSKTLLMVLSRSASRIVPAALTATHLDMWPYLVSFRENVLKLNVWMLGAASILTAIVAAVKYTTSVGSYYFPFVIHQTAGDVINSPGLGMLILNYVLGVVLFLFGLKALKYAVSRIWGWRVLELVSEKHIDLLEMKTMVTVAIVFGFLSLLTWGEQVLSQITSPVFRSVLGILSVILGAPRKVGLSVTYSEGWAAFVLYDLVVLLLIAGIFVTVVSLTIERLGQFLSDIRERLD